MSSISSEASKVVLTPIGASQLHSHGLVIAQETIYIKRDEKRELFGRILQQGEDITIEYRVNGIRADVVYRISHLEPPHAYVGKGTVVIIEGESPGIRRGVALRYDTGVGINRSVTSREEYHSNIQPVVVHSRRGHTFEIRRLFRATVQERLSWLEEQIRLCENSGLDANKLISEANSLQEELKDYW